MRHQPLLRIQHPRHRMNLRRLQRLLKPQRSQNRRQPLGQHRLARPRRPDHQYIVSTRRRHLQRPLRHLLPAHILEVERKVLHLIQQIRRLPPSAEPP